MSPRINRVASDARPSPTMGAAAGKTSHEDPISLAVGEPSDPPPPEVGAAAERAIAEGRTRYGAVPGLIELRERVAADHAEPVRVGEELVLGIDRGDRILEIGDGGERRFQLDVADTRRVGTPDGVLAVEQDLDMQAVVAEQESAGRGADELAVIRKLAVILALDPAPAPRLQRQGLIEEPPALRDNRGAAILIVAARARRRRGVSRRRPPPPPPRGWSRR